MLCKGFFLCDVGNRAFWSPWRCADRILAPIGKAMQISVNIKGLDALKNQLTNQVKKNIQFATAKALTKTAVLVKEAEINEMRDVFDRPKPNTLNSLYIKPATPASLTATVGIKDFAGKGIPASKYLAAQIKGGSRRLKRFEKALQSVGALPPGYRAVPGDAAKMDAFGNMQGGQIVQILSFFKAFPEAGYKANMTDKRKARLARGTKKTPGFAYFCGRPGDRLPLGIWQRFNTGIKPVIIFVPSTSYEAIFDFEYVARSTVNKVWHEEFTKALSGALSPTR